MQINEKFQGGHGKFDWKSRGVNFSIFFISFARLTISQKCSLIDLQVEVSDMKKPLNQLRLRGIIQNSRWPHAIVPYTFHKNFSEHGSKCDHV